ncbi:hypothetical protein SSX86_030268 [Deinandra increscens subsp. villosa]|uniref:DUF4283 domain-containing protein n=1 Tax=Deinandra increscens subsp. villosa TaxID=3103831 RepID=A0AAP0CB13_9ASTR
MNGSGFFFFRFADHKGMMEVLEGGPWLIRNRPIFLNIWTPTARLKKEDIQQLAVWVKFHDVPLAAYSADGLSMLATKVGTPKLLDSYTEAMCHDNWGRSSYARALIEISSLHEFKEMVSIAIPELDGSNYTVVNVQVEYEWKPPRCNRCGVFGHTDTSCPKMPPKVANTTPEVVDEDGFTRVTGKKGNKKTGVPVKKQNVKVVYRPVNIKTQMDAGASSSNQTVPKQKQKTSTRDPNDKVETSNPFAILSDGENRVIQMEDLQAHAALLRKQSPVRNQNNVDEEVEEIYNETTGFMVSGMEVNKGASTPSSLVSQ